MELLRETQGWSYLSKVLLRSPHKDGRWKRRDCKAILLVCSSDTKLNMKAWRKAKLALSTLDALKTSFSKAKVCGPLEPQTPVLISFQFLFFRTVVANRILYVDDSEGQFGKAVLSPCLKDKVSTYDESIRPIHRMAIGWGTTRRHLLRGEELVAIERRKNGDVTFEISSFSVASHPLTFLLTPLTQRLQQRFAKEASDTVKRIVNKPS